MKLSIVFGFFLPVPAAQGGATEKCWHQLARYFAAAGHEVTIVSRQWKDQPRKERRDGLEFRRVRGAPHSRRLAVNLVHDFAWSLRAARVLPPGTAVISHSVALPAWLPRVRRSCGGVIPVLGRMPKGQLRTYGRVARLYATSRFVAETAGRDAPRLRDRIRLVWYPIDWSAHAAAAARTPSQPVTVGFAGRLHPEKGIELLLGAARRLAAESALPPWRLELIGPLAVPQGGAGERWWDRLEAEHAPALGDRLSRLPAQFDPARLAEQYGRWDIFCYPSVAERGETFGVAVAEAMAAGCAPVVSALDCFRDLVQDGSNGLVFDHRSADREAALARALEGLIRDAARRRAIAERAQEFVRRFDLSVIGANILADLATLP